GAHARDSPRSAWGAGLAGRSMAAASPRTATTPSEPMASAYAPFVRPETRIVPAIAVPKVEPRLDTLRDSPENPPCFSSGKLDCTTLTEGVSITPRPKPINRSPGTKATTLDHAPHRALTSTI